MNVLKVVLFAIKGVKYGKLLKIKKIKDEHPKPTKD